MSADRPLWLREWMLDFGHHLRKCREKKRIGLRDLAKLAGCSPTHLSDIELGKRTPSPELLKKLERELQ